MSRSCTNFFLLFVVASCGGAAGPSETTPGTEPKSTILPQAELGALMKNDLNPPFSKLTFLVFHGKDAAEDPATVRAEMQRSIAALRASIARLRTWQNPPVTSEEGKDVFYTFASSLEASSMRFEKALGTNDTTTASSALSQIAKTCNNCHHFFRLNLKDSDEGPGTAAIEPHSAPMTAPAMAPLR